MAKNTKTTKKGTIEEHTLKDHEIMQKNVSFYEVLFTAWMDNRMEKDKQILTLSALAIGLLMTFRSEIKDFCSFFILALASSSFTGSMIVVLGIFKKNSDFIMQLIQKSNKGEQTDKEEKEMVDNERSLRNQTLLAFWLFIVGVGFTFILSAYRIVPEILKGV